MLSENRKMAVLFDLDGTLWDASKEVGESWDEVTKSLKTPFRVTTFDMKRTMGKTMDEIAKTLFLPYLPKEELPALQRRCEEHENEYLKTHPGTLYPGVKETLETLTKEYPLYIVSNCQKGYIEAFLDGTGLSPLFSGHLCYGDTLRPKGETIRILLAKEGIASAIYVGDTDGDAKAAHFARLPFIHASYGFGRTEEKEGSVSRFEELPDAIRPLLKGNMVVRDGK